MYENSGRYLTGKHAATFLVTATRTMQTAAEANGVGLGTVEVVMRLSAMKGSGAQVLATDLAATELSTSRYLDKHLAEAKRRGWLTSNKGKLHVTSAGRQLVADVTRGWERAARKLVAFSSALPFRKRAAKRNEDQA